MNEQERTNDSGNLAALMGQLNAAKEREAKLRTDCVNRHADAERLVEWVNDPNRKPAITAFTEGPDRQVAYAVDERLEADNAKLREEIERSWKEAGLYEKAMLDEKADNARLRAESEKLFDDAKLIAARFVAEEIQNQNLRAVVERLQSFARHLPRCGRNAAGLNQNCNCGYDEALVESAEGLKGEKIFPTGEALGQSPKVDDPEGQFEGEQAEWDLSKTEKHNPQTHVLGTDNRCVVPNCETNKTEKPE